MVDIVHLMSIYRDNSYYKGPSINYIRIFSRFLDPPTPPVAHSTHLNDPPPPLAYVQPRI